MEVITINPESNPYLTPEWITAACAALSAFALILLTFITTSKLGTVASQVSRVAEAMRSTVDTQKEQRTLEAVRRYETDTELRATIKAIWEKTDQNQDYRLLDDSDRFHVINLLNYYDGIASGIEQGIYIEALVRDYLAVVLDKAVRALLRGESGPDWVAGQPLVAPENYHALLRIQQQWAAEANRSLYEMLR